MKKMIAMVATLVIAISMNAQNSVVYYSPVSETMEVGVGFDRQSHKMVLSIIEESKKDVDFSFDILSDEGESVIADDMLDEGTVNVLPKTRKVSYYECNYSLSMPELMDLMAKAQKADKVLVNGQEIDGSQLAESLQSIAETYMQPVRHHKRG